MMGPRKDVYKPVYQLIGNGHFLSQILSEKYLKKTLPANKTKLFAEHTGSNSSSGEIPAAINAAFRGIIIPRSEILQIHKLFLNWMVPQGFLRISHTVPGGYAQPCPGRAAAPARYSLSHPAGLPAYPCPDG